MTRAAQLVRRRRARRARRTHALAQRRRWGVLLGALLVSLLGAPVAAVAVVGGTTYVQAARTLPAPGQTPERALGSLQLVAADGVTPLGAATRLQDGSQDAVWWPLDALPDALIAATLLAEDPHFLAQARFAPFATGWRLLVNAVQGPIGPEPSLAGRLVRNALWPVPRVPNADDRARETVLVAELLRRYSPQELLAWHLNTNTYGPNVTGIAQAARLYLGKPADTLTLDEAALLAAIPTAPQYNPFDDEAAARGRQADLLRQMLRAGAITQAEYDQAAAVQTRLARPAPAQAASADAQAFTQYARRQAEALLDQLGYGQGALTSMNGLVVVTTLDAALQADVACQLSAALGTPQPGCPPSRVVPVPDVERGAVVVLDVTNGAILAWVDDATTPQAPGPTLLPFVYFEGFRGGLYYPARMVYDLPLRFPGAAEGLIYTPTNADGRFEGPMNLRDAMASYVLPAAVQVANAQGMDRALRTAEAMGVRFAPDTAPDLWLLERGGGASLLDIAYAYGVLADQGTMHGLEAAVAGRGGRTRDPLAIAQIRDADGTVLWDASAPGALYTGDTVVFPEGLGYLVNHVLSDPAPRLARLGAARANTLVIDRPAAVVDGVAEGEGGRGAPLVHWTVGYTPQRVVGVWLGGPAPVEGAPQPTPGAAPVWNASLRAASAVLPVVTWPQPADVVIQAVCQRSGALPNGVCPTREEVFLANMQRLDVDTQWQAVEVNARSGRLATANTPPAVRERRVFFVPPADALDWWRANQQPLPPTEYDTVSRPEVLRSAAITAPTALEYVGGAVTVRGALDAPTLATYRLSYGLGVAPDRWTSITGNVAQAPADDVLATWDTSGLDGLVNLSLSVTLRDGTFEEVVVPVTVDNVPPTVTLSAGTPGQTFERLRDGVVPLSATASDNLTVAYVEFYHNGVRVASDESWPYRYDWPIAAEGVQVFSVVAFDSVGNQANAALEVTVTRGGS